MSGRSGSRVAAHTRLARIGGLLFAVSPAQARLLDRCRAGGGATHVMGSEVRSARTLVSLRLGSLRDDGNCTLRGGIVDGERWTFEIAEGVSW
jgi:hypothetical protein